MKVFISWSGDYSKRLGAAIHWWLPKVLSVDVYFSDVDIGVGARWYHSIVDNLEQSDAGLIIVTPENITRQWLMFEAGAMARSVTQARVCPILFDITMSEFNLNGGPLAFFQGVEFTEDDFRKLQKTINNGKLGEEDLRERFAAWWSGLNERIKKIDATPQPALKEPDEKELLGEILGHTRAILREFEKQQGRMLGYESAARRLLGLGGVSGLRANTGSVQTSPRRQVLLDVDEPSSDGVLDGTVAKSNK
jgi:hypothetical protein